MRLLIVGGETNRGVDLRLEGLWPTARRGRWASVLLGLGALAGGSGGAVAGEADWIADNQVPLSQIADFDVHGYIGGSGQAADWTLGNDGVTSTSNTGAPGEFNASRQVGYYRLSEVNIINNLTPQLLAWAVPGSTVDPMTARVLADAHRAGALVYGTTDHANPANLPASIRNQALALTSASNGSPVVFTQLMINAAANHGFDGWSLDWEYPGNPQESDAYAGILRNMQEHFGDLKVGFAPQYVVPLSHPAAAVPWVDNVQLQSYDVGFGTHGTFQQAVDATGTLRNAGYNDDQLQLGIPFYTNGTQVGYNTLVDQIYPSSNTAMFGAETVGMGSPDVVRQRVRYAIDQELGGVMLFQLQSDLIATDRRSLLYTVASEVDRHFQRPWRPFNGADVIGINFQGAAPTALGENEVAGLAAQRYWNTVSGTSGVANDLRDGRNNVASGLRVTFSSPGAGRLGLQDTAGERRLIDGYLAATDSDRVQVTVNGISYQDYYVIAYHDGDYAPYARSRYNLRTFDEAAPGQTENLVTDVNDPTNFTGRLNVGNYNGSDLKVNGAAHYSVFGVVEGRDSFTLESQGVDGLRRGQINGLQIIDLSNRISLSNIVAGGDGFDSETGLGLSGDPLATEQGQVIHAGPEPFVHGSSFPSFSAVPYDYVDRVFTPSGNFGGFVDQPIDSTGTRFHFGIDAGVGGPYGTIYSGFGAAGDPTSGFIGGLDFEAGDFISFGAQNGITFDLQAIRDDNPQIALDAFTAIVGDNRNVAGGSIDYFVILDGEVVQWDIDLTDTEQLVYIKLEDTDRLLTLAVTDSADGIGDDRGYFANAFLLHSSIAGPLFGDLDGDGDVDDADFGLAFAAFTGPGGVPVPEPGSLALLGLGSLAALRHRRQGVLKSACK